MSVIRWNPYQGLSSLPKDLDHFFGNFGLDFQNTDKVWNPSIDVIESENDYEVKAEIPGMEKDDIKVSFEDNMVTLTGEKKRESEENDRNYRRIERSYGKFERSFRLPNGINVDEIKANYKNGVLSISMPKSEASKPKEIAVK